MNYKNLALLLIPLLAACAQKRPEVVERPAFDSWSSTAMEIDKIELSDTATVFYIDVYYPANARILISEGTFIRENGSDQHLSITGAEGIKLQEWFPIPESGQISFKLFFPPLDPKISKIDLIECESANCFNIWGIELIPSKQGISIYSPELSNSEKLTTLPPLDFSDEPAIIKGKVFGYQKGMEFSDIMFAASSPILQESDYDKIAINEDGTFTIEAQTGLPVLSYLLPFGVKVFAVPGHETTVVIDLNKKSRFESKYRTDKEEGDADYAYVENNWLSADEMNILRSIEAKQTKYYGADAAIKAVVGKTPEEYYNWVLQAVDSARACYNEYPALSEKIRILAESNMRASVLNIAMSYTAANRQAYIINTPPEERGANLPEFPFLDENYFKNALRDFVDESFAYNASIGYVSSLIMDYYYPDHLAKQLTELQFGNPELITDIASARMLSGNIEAGQFFTEEKKALLPTSINEAMAKQLIEYNDKLAALIESNQFLTEKGVVVNPTPNVASDKLLDAIVAKYKGKVVLVDFWATWCGPCMSAMESIKPVKAKFEGKDVVFLYLTGETSPLGIWNKTIPEIKGEHYRVSGDQWEAMSNKLEIQGVPTYMVFDKNGQLTDRYVGFPGTDTIEESINKSL